MTHGFDLNSPLVCEGIVGDGCGGGRIFFVEDETLFVYDPLTQERMELLRELKDVKKITKKGCDITIESANKTLLFNLSLLKIIS
jgi:hypothetical protein